MKARSTTWLALCSGAISVAVGASGCGSGPDATYGVARGESLNGTSVLVRMLTDRGHEVRVARRLTDELADWAGGIVRIASHPGPPDEEEAAWYKSWLEEVPDRFLIYVVRDFDASHEYWTSVAESPAAAADPDLKAHADESREHAAGWVDRLPKKAKVAAPVWEWFDVDTAWMPARACKKLGGPWAKGIDAAAAALLVHEPIKAVQGKVLLDGDGKPLVVETTIGDGRALLIASGAFLLNEAVVNPARRPLAKRVVDWSSGAGMLNRGSTRLAMVDGSAVLGEVEQPTLWALLKRFPPLRWLVFQIGLAALVATLARAPRLGRPRPDPPSGADRPAEHALALGALLARRGDASLSYELLDRYRRWRHPRPQRPEVLPSPAGVSNLPGESLVSHRQP